ncbi:MAG TPA: Ig-like domain-containing protein [Gemmatimonadaceae bacterium]|nr:Ig-like domain-containing protein [Gemmatimonadaceae bacterium]
MLAICVLIAGSACSDSSAPVRDPNDAAQITARAGNAQVAFAGMVLPVELGVAVTDAEGRPVRGVTVTWTSSNGTFDPLTSSTDGSGSASTTWRLGPTTGQATAEAHVESPLSPAPARFTATALARPAAGPDDPVPLVIATYEHSEQVVHPDVTLLPDALGGHARVLAITPYPGGNAAFENPSVFAGDGDDQWLLDPGAHNPVVSPPSGYLSDPDILYDPESQALWMYYRQVTSSNTILLVRSSDGISWSAPMKVAEAPNHLIVSPSVVRRAPHDWLMWSVNSGASGCGGPSTTVELRRSDDGVHWSEPQTVTLDQPGVFPWHIDVEWIPSRNVFWALYNGKRPGSCDTPALYFAESSDGVTWHTFPAPLLARGVIPEFSNIVYRSSLAYDPASDRVTVWYSGALFDGAHWVWSAAVQRLTREALMQKVSRTSFGFPSLPGGAFPAAPPLLDGP